MRAEVERKGNGIGEYDPLTADKALSRNLALIIAKIREFGRVKGFAAQDCFV